MLCSLSRKTPSVCGYMSWNLIGYVAYLLECGMLNRQLMSYLVVRESDDIYQYVIFVGKRSACVTLYNM